MKLFLVLPVSGTANRNWVVPGAQPAHNAPAVALPKGSAVASAYFPFPVWAVSLTVACCPRLQLVGPGEQTENQEEDADDLELEGDEDPNKLRIGGAQPGTEEGSTPARDGDGTINPPFP